MVLANLMIKPIWIFGIDRNVQLSIGDANYGLYAALLNFSIVFNIFLDIGLTNYNNIEVAQNTNALHKHLATIGVAKFILFFIYLIILFVCAFLFHYNFQSLKILFLAAVIQFLNSYVAFLRSNINAHHLFKADSFLSIADKIITIFICALYLFIPSLKPHFTLFTFLYSQIIGYLVAIIIALIFTKKIVLYKIEFLWKDILPIIKNSLPYALLILLMGIYIRSDMFLIERWLPNGSTQSGLYVKSFRLLDACNMISFLFAGMLLPIFARLIAEQKNIKPLLKISFDLLIPISIAISIFCVFNAQEILQILYKHSDALLINTFKIIMCTYPAMCIMNIYSTLLTSTGKLNKLIFIALFGCVLSVCGNYFALTYFQNYFGAAIIAIFVQYLVGGFYIFYSYKQFGNLNLIQNSKTIVLTIVWLVLVGFLLQKLNCNIIIKSVLYCGAYLPIFYFLDFFNIKKLQQYFKIK